MRPTIPLCLPLLGAAVAVPPPSTDARVCRGSACEVAVSGDDDAVHEVSLLSVKHGLLTSRWKTEMAGGPPALAAMDAESQRERLEAARPIAWLHVPKAGTSLENFMIHLPGICPGIEEDLLISEETMGPAMDYYFAGKYGVLQKRGHCAGSFSHWCDHSGAGPSWDELFQGHLFMMLRQPEQRVLSDYYYNQMSKLAFNELGYAEGVQGCTVRMLTQSGDFSHACGGLDSGLPTWDQVALAIHRIRTGSAFVGIMEQWPLSMCLGHRIFGGKCRMNDFINTRASTKGHNWTTKLPFKPHLHDLTPLGDFRDPYDGALYQAALEVFQENLLRYNVSMESCQSCFEEAGVDYSA